MKRKIKLDTVDQTILEFLIDNARIPFTEIAKQMDVSPGTIHVRVKKMEEMGLIRGTSISLDYNLLGYNFITFVGILLQKSSGTHAIIDQLNLIPNVVEANAVSGKFSIFCKIVARNSQELTEILYRIDELENVLRTETMIALQNSINDENRLLHSIFEPRK